MKKALIDILKHVIIKLLDIFFAVIGDEVKKYCKRDDVRAKAALYALPRLMKASFALKQTTDRVATVRKRATAAVDGAKKRVRSATEWVKSKVARKKREAGGSELEAGGGKREAESRKRDSDAVPETRQAPSPPPAPIAQPKAPPKPDASEPQTGLADRLAEMLRQEKAARDRNPKS